MREYEYRQLFEILVKDEAFRSKPYDDSTGKPYAIHPGKLTIGVGRNIQDVGITYDEAEYMCINDIKKCEKQVQQLHFYETLDTVRKFVLLNMCFNLGYAGLCKFKNMLNAVEQKDYKRAAIEMLDSRWATQVGRRALRLAKEMEFGEFF